MARKYAVVGCGVAGVTASQFIRETDERGEIRIFTDEKYPFYSRMRLPEVVAGRTDPERLFLKGLEWFREMGIHFHPQEPIEKLSLNPLGLISSKAHYEADTVLLATGGHAFLPPLPGAESQGVMTLRSMDDAIRIRDKLGQVSRAVVIGGGLLGLELANAVRLRGVQVTVVEVFDRLLPRQTDPIAARFLQKSLEDMGLSFHLGVPPQGIDSANGRATALILQDGTRLEGELFLVSAGVRPNSELAREAGLKVDKAIVVNDKMETSAAGIYGAGDCIEHRGVYYGIWHASEEQGRVAGTNMAGGDATYTGSLMSNQLKVVGIDMIAAGDIDPEGKLESEQRQDPNRRVYRKIVYKGDAIAGLLLLGDISGHTRLLKAMKQSLKLGNLKGSLLDNIDKIPL
jgi:nitrite reductase (NADH) large subunit